MEQELKDLMEFKNISYDENAVLETGENAKGIFCQHWPEAKLGLEALLATIKNPVVRWTIRGVLALGSGLYAKRCS
jgi:hypothetical protein